MNQKNTAPKAATKFTLAINQAMSKTMQSFDLEANRDAARGFIAPLPNNGDLNGADGSPVLQLSQFAFLDDEKSKETVNPSLLEQSRLMRLHGLFKVTERIYQVRGIGSSITFIEGDTGIIVVDSGMSLTAAETSRELFFKHRPRKPVKAMIITHPHSDHNGGVTALIDPEEIGSGKVKIYAPQNYMEELISEGLLAGTTMRRRAGYMFGQFLPINPRAMAGIGIGIYNTRGKRAALAPTDFITHTGQTLNLDGLDFEFQLAREGEAPVELHFFIRQLKAFTTTESCEHTMHNIYTPRGAKTRNSLVWSKILQEAMDLWGEQADVLFTSHSWPVWGKENIKRHLSMGRDGYRFINDQTLHLAALGHTPDEIGETIRYPEKLEKHWSMRGHYGSLNHNAKGAYNYYFGWFDGNPATLNPLPKTESAKLYIEYMGGASTVLKKARGEFEQGKYRWVAELLNHLVFAETDNQEAKELLADAYEQLGYQTETATWRNIYLTAAMELRGGVVKRQVPAEGIETGMNIGLLLDYLSIRMDSLAAGGLQYTFNLELDQGELATAHVSNGVISHSMGRLASKADARISGPFNLLSRVIFGSVNLSEAIASGLKIEGNADAFAEVLSYRVNFEPWFNIVTP